MKKRIVSTLLSLCMLLCLVPTAAFAEESAETPPVCSCETACTAESMNAACPVCGAEGADPENCKCATVESEQKAAPISNSSFPTEDLADPVIRINLSSDDGGYYAIEKDHSTAITGGAVSTRPPHRDGRQCNHHRGRCAANRACDLQRSSGQRRTHG